MSFQWTLAATFLYIEVFFIVVLLLPLISPQRWQKIFKSRIVTAVTSYAGLYFNVILLILGLLLADAIREIIKYKPTTSLGIEDTSLTSAQLIKELRGQRNFHISGTALFLWFVIKRLLALISNSAFLIAESEASKKQAQSASRVANSLIDEMKKDPNENNNEKNKKNKENEEIKTLKEDFNTLKKQNDSLKSVYDNLLTEYAKLEASLQKYEKPNENKKNF